MNVSESQKNNNGKVKILPRTLSKEEFIKNVLDYLRYSDTPIDVFEASFGEVFEEEIEIIVGKGRANIQYTREIGYDREEQYVEETIVYTGSYDKVDEYGNKYRREVKNRIVTDWKIDNGNIVNNGMFTILNTEQNYPRSFINALQSNLVKDDNVILDEREINELHIEKFDILKGGIASNVYYSNVPKMGDKQRNDKYNYSINEFSYNVYAVPLLSINITLREKTYKITSVALKKCLCFLNEFDYKFEVGEYENKKEELCKGIQKNLDKIHNTKIPFTISTFLFGIAGLSTCLFDSNGLVLGLILLVIGVISLIFFILLSVKFKNIEGLLNKYNESFKEHCKNKKKNDYINKLREFNIPYSGKDVEVEGFDIKYYEELYAASYLFKSTPKSEIKKDKNKKNTPKKRKLLLGIIGSILTVAIIIGTIIFANPIKYIKNSDGTYSVDGCKSYVTEVNIPSTHMGKAVTSIDRVAFAYDSIETIVIPSSITHIGEGAFRDCRDLESVYYNGTIEDWCNITFDEQSSNPMLYAKKFYILDKNGDFKHKGEKYILLTEIVLPDIVTTIRQYAFNNLKNVVSMIIPRSVTTIDQTAFYGCDNMKIYCELEYKPISWGYEWCPSYVQVYWAGEWTYDSNGKPAPLN